MFTILKDKKGITLIEMVVALVIFSIMTVAIAFVLVPTLKTYDKANDLAEVNTIIDAVGMEISSELERAEAPPVITGGAGGDSDEISIQVSANNQMTLSISDDGILMKNLNKGDPTAAIGKSFYKNKKVRMSCTPTSGAVGAPKAYMVSVTVLKDDGGSLMSREYAVKPLALKYQ